MALNKNIIRQTEVISASPMEVYEALMDEKKHSKFTGQKAKISTEVGGKFTAMDEYISGKNLQLVKGKKIVQEWRTTDWDKNFPPSKLTIELKKKGTGTELVMVHENVPEDDKADLTQGWIDFYWKPLKAFFNK